MTPERRLSDTLLPHPSGGSSSPVTPRQGTDVSVVTTIGGSDDLDLLLQSFLVRLVRATMPWPLSYSATAPVGGAASTRSASKRAAQESLSTLASETTVTTERPGKQRFNLLPITFLDDLEAAAMDAMTSIS